MTHLTGRLFLRKSLSNSTQEALPRLKFWTISPFCLSNFFSINSALRIRRGISSWRVRKEERLARLSLERSRRGGGNGRKMDPKTGKTGLNLHPVLDLHPG